nr:MAG TPA: hypothetical protein [Caudoviricetes sp.]
MRGIIQMLAFGICVIQVLFLCLIKIIRFHFIRIS